MKIAIMGLSLIVSMTAFSSSIKNIDKMPIEDIRELLSHLDQKLIYEAYNMKSALFPESVTSYATDTFAELYSLPENRLEKNAGDHMSFPEIGSLLCYAVDIDLDTAKCIVTSNNDYPEYHEHRHRVKGNHLYSLRAVKLRHGGYVNPAHAFCKAVIANGNNDGVSDLRESIGYYVKSYTFNYKKQSYTCPYEEVYIGH